MTASLKRFLGAFALGPRLNITSAGTQSKTTLIARNLKKKKKGNIKEKLYDQVLEFEREDSRASTQD